MLKKFIISALIIFTFSCNENEETIGYKISGTISESIDGKTMRLRNADLNNPSFTDSTVIENGKINFHGNVESPDLYVLTIDGIPGGLPIVLENEDMSIQFYKDSLQSSIVTGSKENDIFKIFKQISDPIRAKNEVMGKEFMSARSQGDTAKMTSIREEFKKIIELGNIKTIDKIKEYNNSVTSAAILENLISTKGIDLIEAQSIFNTFSDDVKMSNIGEKVEVLISKSLATEIGSLAPDFTAPNPSGETITLSDIKGKITIIDFWAAWCGPCRKENPNVVKVYNKYHDKGLEIIGVSLDGNKRQQDPKKAWVEAIEKDSLDWHHVSNLNYFNDPVAKLYNIQSIPATFIIDNEGKIIAKNLRGSALEEKIAELLD